MFEADTRAAASERVIIAADSKAATMFKNAESVLSFFRMPRWQTHNAAPRAA